MSLSINFYKKVRKEEKEKIDSFDCPRNHHLPIFSFHYESILLSLSYKRSDLRDLPGRRRDSPL